MAPDDREVVGVDARSDAESVLRRLMLGLLLLGHLGLGSELLLMGHTEQPAQWIPLVLLALGFAAATLQALRPGPAPLTALRGLMALQIVAGGVGVALHYRGNVEFALEQAPALAGTALVAKALTGAFPALAPGALVQLGLVGLAYGYRHPLRRSRVAIPRRSVT